ncbi:MAG TPA: glycosyltransferase [Vitreimonas sp.]|nr:glycosyltransferase [Vitreimonas sp.]
MKKLKVALAHDYLIDYGGAERVLEALHEVFPEAPVYIAFKNEDSLGIHWRRFKDWDLRESWITRLPFYKRLFSPLRIWAHRYFASFDLSEYDVVISSSNAYMAKAVEVPNGVHICYCHTPPRSLYGYSTMSNWRSNPVFRVVGSLINHYVRVIDVKVAQQVDYFIANSEEIAQRIQKFYRRDSEIIYPPVNISAQPPSKKQEGEYYLYVNRLALAKHPELAVQAATELQLPLKVVGTGVMLDKLRELAGPTVEFLGAVDDEKLHELYAGAKALLYPVEDEDFGIVPVEAMGHGVPVIAHRSGGPRETIQDGVSGVFFDELSVEGLKAAIKVADKKKFDAVKIYQLSKRFSKAEFQKKIVKFVERCVKERG